MLIVASLPTYSQREYEATVSTSTWPSQQYWVKSEQSICNCWESNPFSKLLQQDLAGDAGINIGQDLANGRTILQVKESVQTAFVKSTVYFKTLNLKAITESEKYTPSTLMAALGGSLSLYLGVAIIMCFELIELAADVCLAVWRHITRGPIKDDYY